MEESGGGGLSVLLRYMNAASPHSEDWIALRAVAELAYISGATQQSSHPLLKITASCDYLRSTDAVAGASYPLLYTLAEIVNISPRAAASSKPVSSAALPPRSPTPIPYPLLAAAAQSSGGRALLSSLSKLPSASLLHHATLSLVEAFVMQVIDGAHAHEPSSAYPILHALSRVAAESRSRSGTPSSQATPPSKVLTVNHTKSPEKTSPHQNASVHFHDVPSYPIIALLEQVVHPQQHMALVPFIQKFARIKEAPINASVDDDGDDDIFFASQPTAPILHRNMAFLFTKPHAFGRPVQQLVEQQLTRSNFRIERCGVMSTERIDKEGLIDKHYAAIARYAMTWSPNQIVLTDKSKQAFLQTFGQPWDACIADSRVLNAKEAMAAFGCRTGAELAEIWGKYPKRVKLAPGLYAGFFSETNVYVLNGFYPANREKFTAPGGFINWYVVSWNERDMAWCDFRGTFLGPTNPADAPPGSLRRQILDQWKELGLKYAPNVSDNGVHASAGPLEGLAERLIWLPNHTITKDVFGRALIRCGVAAAYTLKLLGNPEVTSPKDGKRMLVFDLLEDVQSTEAVDVILRLQSNDQNAGAPLTPLSTLGVCINSPENAQESLKHVRALVQLFGASTTTAATALQVPTVPVTATVSSSSAPAPAPPANTSASPTHDRKMVPAPPASLKPKGIVRNITSPYLFVKRNNGIGLEFVFQSTLLLMSSKKFAVTLVEPNAVSKAFFGLKALHAAVFDIKATRVPDPFIRVVTKWEPTVSKNIEIRRAAGALSLPPIAQTARPPVAVVMNSTQQNSSLATTFTALTSRPRLSTADRIKRRTARLQEEILALNQRHEVRMNLHHQNAVSTSPRRGPLFPSGSSTSPRDAKETPQAQAKSPRIPAAPSAKSGAVQDNKSPYLPSIRAEQVKLRSPLGTAGDVKAKPSTQAPAS